jgi:uncharacterized membrane protein YbhN (UPF0104 family)
MGSQQAFPVVYRLTMTTSSPGPLLEPDSPGTRSASRWLPAWVSIAARLAATTGLMAYALRGVDWQQFIALLKNAEWRWWAAGFLVGIAVQVLAALRWSALARPLGFEFPRWLFIWRFFEGSFFSLCLPSSIGGDVVKAYRLGDTTPRRLLAGCSVLADRLTGLAALGVLAGAALVATEQSLGMPATLLVAGLLLAVAVLAFRIGVGSLDRLLDLLPTRHPARHFIAQLLPYHERPQLMSRAVAWSLLVQAGGAISVALIARSLGVVQPLTIWFSVIPLTALAMVLPISINGVGVRENALAILLAPHGVSQEKAIAIGLLWLASQIATGLIGGLLFLLDRSPVITGSPAAAD